MRYQISITRAFRARHAIRLPDGTWERPHSHRWMLEVTVGSTKLDAIETVMDFHELEAIVDGVVEKLTVGPRRDINQARPFAEKIASGQDPRSPRTPRTPPSPTAERIAEWIGHQVKGRLTRGVQVIRIRLGEAPGCTAVFEPGE